jgi:ABC-type Fe3+-hydroxamate transport system substrate-binding protein
MSARSLGRRRPLVAPIVSLDPLVLAGGHSFVSDLVEAAGAETITHGDEVAEVHAPRLDRIQAAAPELILVATRDPPTAHEESVLRSWFGATRVAFVPIDADELWLGGSLDAAVALQQLVDELRSERDR